MCYDINCNIFKLSSLGLIGTTAKSLKDLGVLVKVVMRTREEKARARET